MRPRDVIAARERFHRGQAALARTMLLRPWGEENREAVEDLVTVEEAKAQVLGAVAALLERADVSVVLPSILGWCLGKPAEETPYWKGWEPGPVRHRAYGPHHKGGNGRRALRPK